MDLDIRARLWIIGLQAGNDALWLGSRTGLA
jgi:hypothetical protein